MKFKLGEGAALEDVEYMLPTANDYFLGIQSFRKELEIDEDDTKSIYVRDSELDIPIKLIHDLCVEKYNQIKADLFTLGIEIDELPEWKMPD